MLLLDMLKHIKALATRHLNKLSNLCNKRSTYSKNVNHASFTKNAVYNMLSYTLSEDEYHALALN